MIFFPADRKKVEMGAIFKEYIGMAKKKLSN